MITLDGRLQIEAGLQVRNTLRLLQRQLPLEAGAGIEYLATLATADPATGHGEVLRLDPEYGLACGAARVHGTSIQFSGAPVSTAAQRRTPSSRTQPSRSAPTSMRYHGRNAAHTPSA